MKIVHFEVNHLGNAQAHIETDGDGILILPLQVDPTATDEQILLQITEIIGSIEMTIDPPSNGRALIGKEIKHRGTNKHDSDSSGISADIVSTRKATE